MSSVISSDLMRGDRESHRTNESVAYASSSRLGSSVGRKFSRDAEILVMNPVLDTIRRVGRITFISNLY